jgi:hypothetical protein
MTDWQAEYRTYDIAQLLEEINSKMPELLKGGPQFHDRLVRIDDVLRLLQSRYMITDLHLTSVLTLQEIKNGVATLQNQINLLHAKNGDLNESVVDDAIAKILRNMPLMQTLSDSTISNDTRALMEGAKSNAKALTYSLDVIFSEAESSLKSIKDLELEGKKLIHLAAGKIKSNDYLNRANDEKGLARNWTIMTWVFAALSILTLIIGVILQLMLISNPQTPLPADVNITFVTSKLVLIATFGIVARWCSKRANKHLLDETRYRRLGINTASMDAFIAELPRDEKAKIVSAVAVHIFTDDGHNEANTDYESSGTAVLDQIKSALQK